MTDLTITQSTTSETVTLAVLNKLYETVLNLGEGHAHINGTLTVQSAYRDDVNYLTNRFNGGSEGKLSINVNQWYIKFASSTLQEFLATKIGDGTGVTETVAATASIGGYNNGWWNQWENKNVSCTFNEFKYFTTTLNNLSSTSWTLREWPGLTEVDFGGNATVVGQSMFEDCSNLETVSGLNNVVEIKPSAFRNCSKISLEQSDFSSSLNKIGNTAFYNSGATGYWDLTNFQSIENRPFYNSKITGIKVDWLQLQNLSDDAKTPWYACDNLTTVDTDFENWTILPNFQGCGHLSKFVMYLPLLTTFPNTQILGVGVWARSYSTAFPGQIYCPNVTNGIMSTLWYEGVTNFGSLFSGGRGGGYDRATALEGIGWQVATMSRNQWEEINA